MAKVKFLRGTHGNYSTSTHANGIYFATDTCEIYLDGSTYGKSDFSSLSGSISAADGYYVKSVTESAGIISGITAALPTLSSLGAVPTSRTISAGTGLTGGGNLTADRTISLLSATATTIGGIKVGAVGTSASGAVNTTSGITARQVLIDSAGLAYVNVPNETHTADTYTGTVTSVGLTVPTGLTVSGSPITSSGTLTVILTSGYIIPPTSYFSNLIHGSGTAGYIPKFTDTSVIANGYQIQTAITDTDSYLPTSGAIVDYVATQLGTLTGAMKYKGTLDGGPTTTYTPAASVGDVYVVSTSGLINGIAVEVGDMFICQTATAAATSANVSTINANWDIVNGENQVDNKAVTLSFGGTKTIATVDGTDITVGLPAETTLSGGASATIGQYVSAVTVSGHTVTITKASLPSGSGSATADTSSMITSVSLSDHTLSATSATITSKTIAAVTAASALDTAPFAVGETLATDFGKVNYAINNLDGRVTTNATNISSVTSTVSDLSTNLSTKITSGARSAISISPASPSSGVVTGVTYASGTGVITASYTSLATSDATASGTSSTFIDTISQAANGKITTTKKTVSIGTANLATDYYPTSGTAGAGLISFGVAAVASATLVGYTVPSATVSTNVVLTSSDSIATAFQKHEAELTWIEVS